MGNEYPVLVKITLDEGQPAYAPGLYTVHLSSFKVGQFGSLMIDRLRLVPAKYHGAGRGFRHNLSGDDTNLRCTLFRAWYNRWGSKMSVLVYSFASFVLGWCLRSGITYFTRLMETSS